MYLDLHHLLRELGSRVLAYQDVGPASLQSFAISDPFEGAADPSVLYIIPQVPEAAPDQPDAAEASSDAEAAISCLLLTDQPDIPARLSNCNVIICRSDGRSDLFSFINLMGGIFSRYNTWEQRLIQGVARNVTFQEMLEIGHEMLGWPMAMMDMNHNILAVTKSAPREDPFLHCLRSGYGADYLNVVSRSQPTLEEVKEKGVVEQISNISFLTIRVRHLHGPHLHSFFLGLHKDDDRPFSEGDVRLFDEFCDYLEVLAMKKKPVPPVFTDPLTPFLEESILNPNVKEESLLALLAEEATPNEGTWQLLGIDFRNQLRFRTDFHYEVIRQLKNVLPPCHFALIDSHIVMLFEKELFSEEYEEALRYAMVVHDAVCAVSNPFIRITDTGKVWKQLLYLLDDANCPDGAAIRFYRDHYAQHALSLICQAFPEELLSHSAFQKLRQYDAQNNTAYCHTLLVYLRNHESKALTAEALNIHKNSLLYRIQKIEELLHIETDLEEFLYLAFSEMVTEKGDH